MAFPLVFLKFRGSKKLGQLEWALEITASERLMSEVLKKKNVFKEAPKVRFPDNSHTHTKEMNTVKFMWTSIF